MQEWEVWLPEYIIDMMEKTSTAEKRRVWWSESVGSPEIVDFLEPWRPNPRHVLLRTPNLFAMCQRPERCEEGIDPPRQEGGIHHQGSRRTRFAIAT